MKTATTILICIALAASSCAQLQQSMQEQKDKALIGDMDQYRYSQFAKRAGGGQEAVDDFHRINMLLLADVEASHKKFPGADEARRCRRFAFGYSGRAGRLLNENLDDDALVFAYLSRMPQFFEEVNGFRGCGIEANALDFSQVYIPSVESLLRTHPDYRTAKFRAAFLDYLSNLETLVVRVRPDRGDSLLRRIDQQRQKVEQFIGQ